MARRNERCLRGSGGDEKKKRVARGRPQEGCVCVRACAFPPWSAALLQTGTDEDGRWPSARPRSTGLFFPLTFSFPIPFPRAACRPSLRVCMDRAKKEKRTNKWREVASCARAVSSFFSPHVLSFFLSRSARLAPPPPSRHRMGAQAPRPQVASGALTPSAPVCCRPLLFVCLHGFFLGLSFF
ncbi:hypothetical protein [Pandoravirus japonicus]|uniref:Uncharacterized protein n=1 Tax=Pandoravirus japonicus TaxID=2823154 RepID=A0A811BT21_9VIRU|nr:hypothetical protein [Pandoravirus japonicus]